MAIQTYGTPLTTQDAAGTLYNTYTTAKSVINPTNLVTLAPNYWQPGKTINLRVGMALSNIVTTPGTVTFQAMMGSIVAWTSGAFQLNATAHTLLPAFLDVELVCQAKGSGTSAKLMGLGTINGIMFTNTAAQVDAVNTTGTFPVPAAAPALGTGFDSTIANTLDFWVGFSISNAGNGVQVATYRPMEMN